MNLRSRILCLTLIPLLALLPMRISHAEMVSTASALADREAISAFLGREDVRSALVQMHVDPKAAAARVDALSDEEIAVLAGKIRTAPAGASAGPGLVLFILAILVALIYCGATLAATGKDKPSACFFPG